MITRGYYIGQIIDDLATISEKVNLISSLGLYDSNKIMEDFCAAVLNIIFEYDLSNLNREKVNHPGLDLFGEDENNKDSMKTKKTYIGFQITSQKDYNKINDSFEKITTEFNKQGTLLSTHKGIRLKILILSKKEKEDKYSKVNPDLLPKVLVPSFSVKEDILDFTDIAKEVVFLDIKPLQELYKYISQETLRVYAELEIPDPNTGGYSRTIEKYVERTQTPKFIGVSNFAEFLGDTHTESVNLLLSDVQNLMESLKTLPRITREVYAELLTRATWDKFSKKYFISVYKIQRIFSNYPNINGDISLLDEGDFLSPDDEKNIKHWEIRLPNPSQINLKLIDLINFSNNKNLDLEKIFVDLDFSEFN